MKYRHKTGAKALIIRDERLLVQQKVKKKREYFTLPGGTVEDGEDLTETLQRECLEEINTEVEPGDLIFVFEHESLARDGTMKKKMDMVFLAKVSKKYEAQNGPKPDPNQKDVVWLPLSDIDQVTFKPLALGDALKALVDNKLKALDDKREKKKDKKVATFWPQTRAWSES